MHEDFVLHNYYVRTYVLTRHHYQKHTLQIRSSDLPKVHHVLCTVESHYNESRGTWEILHYIRKSPQPDKLS
jgi:hypothetical protein